MELKIKQQIGELVLQCIALQHRVEQLEQENKALKEQTHDRRSEE